MYKPNASFNLSKPVKIMMANMIDKERRSLFKKAMIQAELSEIYAPRTRPGRGENPKGE